MPWPLPEGIGENSSRVREQVCEGLAYLGIHLNSAANQAPAQGDRVISLPCSRVAVVVVYMTNEELVVAKGDGKGFSAAEVRFSGRPAEPYLLTFAIGPAEIGCSVEAFRRVLG